MEKDRKQAEIEGNDNFRQKERNTERKRKNGNVKERERNIERKRKNGKISRERKIKIKIYKENLNREIRDKKTRNQNETEKQKHHR